MFGAVSRRRLRLTFLAASSALAVVASGLELPAVHGVSIGLPGGGRIEIGAIRTSATLFGAALAQMPNLQERFNKAAEGVAGGNSVTLDNLTLDYGGAVVRVPKIEFSGASLTRAELLALFDKNATEPLSPRLAKLSAKRVSVPELVVEQQVGPQRQVTRYRNLVASDIVSGRAASIVSEGAAFEAKGSDADVTGTMGRLAATDLDLAGPIRVYTERAGETRSELKRLYGAFSLDDFTVTTEKGVRVKVAKVAGKDFFARQTKQSLMELIKGLGTLETPEKPSAADQAKMFATVAEFYDAMQMGLVEATGIEISDPNKKEPVAGRIARISYTGGKAGQPADMRMERMEIGSDKGKARIDLIAFTGFSFESTIAGMRTLGTKPLQDVDVASLRSLVPTIGTIQFSGVDFDVPNEKAKEPKAENIKFSVKSMEITADKPLNGIPTNLRLGMEGFHFPLPPDTTEEGLKDLVAMGYKALDLSWMTAASWNEAANELQVREVSLRGAEMGSASLKGVLGSVSKDVFNPDSAIALVALLGATVKNADVTIQNGGLVEKLLAREARKQNKTPEQLRTELGAAAAVAIPAMLGNSPSAKSIGQAVARFAAKPGKLTISAATKDPAGLGVADLATLGEPAAILGKLDVTATAE
jgi:hypothetical protein